MSKSWLTPTHDATRVTMSRMLQALSVCGPPCLYQMEVPGGERWCLVAGEFTTFGDDPQAAVVSAYVAWRRELAEAALTAKEKHDAND